MKIVFITTIYQDRELLHVTRLKKEIKDLKLEDYEFVMIDSRLDNRGYAHGINLGIEKAKKMKADIFVIVNPDISIPKNTDIVAGAEKFDIWGGAMRQNGTVYYGGTLDKWRMSSILIEKKPSTRFLPVDFVSGACMFVKKEVIEKIGLWDESYFLYYDEVDYCMRAKRTGFRLGIDSKLQYDHFEKSDTYNPKKRFFLAKNRFRFFLKYASPLQYLYEAVRVPKTLYEERGLLWELISERKFLMNFAGLNASSFLGKICNFILFLFLVRYLSPGEYGTYILVWTQINVFSPILDFGTTSYGLIHISKDQIEELRSVFSVRIFFAVLAFFLTLIVTQLSHFSKDVNMLIYLLSVVLFANMASGSYLILTSIRGKSYLSSIVSTVFNILLTAVLVVMLVMTGSLFTLFLAIFGLYTIYTLVNGYMIRRELGSIPLNLDTRKWWQIVRRSYIFVLISFFAGLYFRLDVYLLAYLKSDADVGIYSAGYKFFEALIFIAASYNIAAAPLLAQSYREGKEQLLARIKRDAKYLVILGFLICAVTYISSSFVLPLILKGNFAPSITVLQITIFALPIILLSSILLNAMYVIEKAYVVIFIFALQAGVNFILNYFFIPRYSYIASSYITVLSEGLNLAVTAIFFFWFYKKLRSKKI